MFDVAIVGAGPAGANLARLIGDKYSVVLIDKRDPGNPDTGRPAGKCCGGLLAPDAQKIIAELGLGIPKDILVDPQLFAVRTIDLTNSLERLYQRFYFNMDRGKFERWLISTIPMSVEKRFNTIFQGYSEIPGGYRIRLTAGRKETTIETRIIVGADGACSKVRRLLAGDMAVPGRDRTKSDSQKSLDKDESQKRLEKNEPQKHFDKNEPQKYLSIQEWFECDSPMPYFTAIFDEEVSDFYSWIIPKDGAILFGAALAPGSDAAVKFELLKSKLTRLGFCFEKKIRTEGAYIYRPRKSSQFNPGRGGIALIGEAAGAISPSSAEGISYALKTSLYLARSLESGLAGFLRRYAKKTRKIRFNLLLKNLKSPAMYVPFLRKLAMKSGLKSIR